MIHLFFNNYWFAYLYFVQLSSRDVAELFIYRIKDVQPIINAMTDADFERTLREADEADRIVENISSDSQALGRLAIDYPLLGMHLSKYHF